MQQQRLQQLQQQQTARQALVAQQSGYQNIGMPMGIPLGLSQQLAQAQLAQQRENLESSPRQSTTEALDVMDNNVFKHAYPSPQEPGWASEEDQALLESRMKGQDWVEISSQLPGRSPESCLRRYQIKVLPQLGIFPMIPISGSDRSQNLAPSSAHVVESCYPLQAVGSSDSESEGDEKYSFPRVISTPEGDYLIAEEQLPSEDFAASLIPEVSLEEAHAFIDGYVGVSGVSSCMDERSWRQCMVEMVKSHRCSIRSYVRIMKEVRVSHFDPFN